MKGQKDLTIAGWLWRTGCALLLAGWAMTALAADDIQCVPPGKWVSGADGKPVAGGAVLESASRKRVVLLGEHHDNAEHHRWQLHVIAGLHALRDDLALGFEIFPRRLQPVLDRWVAGELTEKEFLARTSWNTLWSFDAPLYLPLFHYARMHRIPMYALNVNESLVNLVREKGWRAVPEAQREGLTDPAPPDRSYLEMLAASFLSHGPAPAPGEPPRRISEKEQAAFQRFVEGQQLWDRAMAEVIAKAVKGEHAPLMVAVMGSGHVVNGFGVPHQLAALDVKSTAVLVPWDDQLSCEEIVPGFADAVFGTYERDTPLEEKPRLGVYLEAAPGGVRVAKVVDGGVAAAGGIRADDVLVEMAGAPVAGVAEVMDKVQHLLPGSWLPVTVLRGGERVEIVAKFPPAK